MSDTERKQVERMLGTAGFIEEAAGDWRHADGRYVRLDLRHSPGMAWWNASGERSPKEEISYPEVMARL